MSAGSKLKHEHIEASLSGEYSEPPILKGNITLNKISVYDHHRFSVGWIKNGRDMRVFDNVTIIQRKSYARGTSGTEIGRKIGGYHSTLREETKFTPFDIELLESKGIYFHPNVEYEKIKALTYVLGLGT